MSPRPGDSTVMTSAPIQSRSCVAVGAACTCPRSRMRTPSRALLIYPLLIPPPRPGESQYVSSLRKQGPTTQLAPALVSKRNGRIEVGPLRIVRFDQLDFP